MAIDGFQGRRGIDGDDIRSESYNGAIFKMGMIQSKMAVSFVGVIDVIPVMEGFLVCTRVSRGESQPVRDFCEKRARMLGKRMQIEAVEDQRGKIDRK